MSCCSFHCIALISGLRDDTLHCSYNPDSAAATVAVGGREGPAHSPIIGSQGLECRAAFSAWCNTESDAHMSVSTQLV